MLGNYFIGYIVKVFKRINEVKDLVKKELSERGNEFYKLPEIVLIHGQLTATEMNYLYNHPTVKAMVSFTKGEGYGRPLQEFAAVGKPVIAPRWSGQVDFLNEIYNIELEGELKQVHPSAVWDDVIIPESKWFYVSYNEAQKTLTSVFRKYGSYKNDGVKNAAYISNYFSLEKMGEKFIELIRSLTEEGEIENDLIGVDILNRSEEFSDAH